MPNEFSRLSERLFIHHGVINVGIISNGSRAMLIDFGEGSAKSTLDDLGITCIDGVLFTHHHRDQSAGMLRIAKDEMLIGVPDHERRWFEKVEDYWSNTENRWHIYNFHPHSLMLTEPIKITDTYKEGDVIKWNDVNISVIETPGHTDGSLSYIIDADGKRFAFCGDVIYEKGQIWELYSLQKGDTTTDYHGFLGSRKQLKESLLKIRGTKPDALIPSHGRIMENPAEAIEALISRLDECYDKYVAISALRYYLPDMFVEFKGRDGHMPIRTGKAVPDFLRHYGTSWIIMSDDGDAFVIDCGGRNVVEYLLEMQKKGEIKNIAGLWVTHYHDDHVDAIPEFQKVFDCPVYADSSVADVVENPLAFRLPCISPSVIPVQKRTKDGESWMWKEFRMTAYHFPGQTYYHGGLLVEGKGTRLFFAGDSFTMSGIDDYCSSNRNWLGEGIGFDRCLALMQELKPTHIFNCHVDLAFDFTDKELGLMRANLSERERLYGEFFPWDSPNYGMDERWICCYPYEQKVKPGEKAKLRVNITNHSPAERRVECCPVVPADWNMEIKSESAVIPAKSEGYVEFTIPIPESINPKRIAIPVEVTYDDRPLGQFREAIFVVQPN